MGELHSNGDNPEVKSSPPETAQPEVAKPSEGDKQKLEPQENDAAKTSKDTNNSEDTKGSEHPKLEAYTKEDECSGEGKNNDAGGSEHEKLSPNESNQNANNEQKDKPQSDNPNGEKVDFDNPNGNKKESDNPSTDNNKGDTSSKEKTEGDNPNGNKKEGDNPNGDKNEGDNPNGDKNEGDNPNGNKKEGDNPNGDKNEGDNSNSKKAEDNNPDGKKYENDDPNGKKNAVEDPNANRDGKAVALGERTDDSEDPDYKSRYGVTPKNNGRWVNEDGSPGERGESKFVPDNPDVQKTLADNGVDGIEYKDCYPDFSPVSKFDAYLDPEDYHASDVDQFQMCNDSLADAVLPDPDTGEIENPELSAQFSDDQLADIANGDTPEGYTWHHDAEAGHMQLVPTDVHQACRHSGGRSLWGGGADYR